MVLLMMPEMILRIEFIRKYRLKYLLAMEELQDRSGTMTTKDTEPPKLNPEPQYMMTTRALRL